MILDTSDILEHKGFQELQTKTASNLKPEYTICRNEANLCQKLENFLKDKKNFKQPLIFFIEKEDPALLTLIENQVDQILNIPLSIIKPDGDSHLELEMLKEEI